MLAVSLNVLGQGNYNGLTYQTNNGAITIIAPYTGTGGLVAIPDTINGLAVTAIAPNAFYSVSVPCTVTLGQTSARSELPRFTISAGCKGSPFLPM